ADDFIREYIPFIRAEASKCIQRLCTEQDDEYSIAMIAFHEAITGYERSRGNFLRYAAMLIRSRIIDYSRKESRHRMMMYPITGSQYRMKTVYLIMKSQSPVMPYRMMIHRTAAVDPITTQNRITVMTEKRLSEI
ncbi:MAG: hypothetical protein IJX14_08410, partial [Clostridia bacterium]|nr:hypothetical protein [Clostridia bacterium]